MINDSAFDGFSFYDGKTLLEISPQALSGHTFRGSDYILENDAFEPVTGESFIADGLIYKIISESPMSVSLIGSEGNIEDLIVPDTVSYLQYTFAVSSVGSGAFFRMDSLKTVNLGSVSTVGSSAFKQCRNLVSVDVGENLKSIGSYAFYKCFKLKTVNLEDSSRTLKSIGGHVFSNCSKISQIAIPSKMNTIGKEAFSLVFQDENGNELSQTAPVLRGYLYKLDGKILVRQPAVEKGTAVEENGLIYSVTGYLPCTVSLSG
ncbi:MAG: leucine-rich repeat domain-containing protein, partial [Candidatus Methanomethylophilaceae archaeon]|nr:leucine-rich repeat domain-containing protein [Candidatus Methanomethylophilaceae archaeon]